MSYSFALEASPDLVYPILDEWSRRTDVWHKRISIVSLIHYSGKNAVFMAPAPMLRIIENCADDDRDSVYKALGWVLREIMATHPAEVVEFLERHSGGMHPFAIRRATQRLPEDTRDELRASLLQAN